MPWPCRRIFYWLLILPWATACERPKLADPGTTARAYAEAAKRGDADAIHRLLSERSKRDLGLEGTRRLVKDARAELESQAQRLTGPDARTEAIAVLRYADGEQATLELEGGVFRVGSAASLPALARTPEQALSDLRQALSRRSYAALVRVLTAETRSGLDSELSAIVRGLEDPETLDVEIDGDRAQVELPDGHVIKLKRETGAWRVEDFR
jgi:hypothetical protein